MHGGERVVPDFLLALSHNVHPSQGSPEKSPLRRAKQRVSSHIRTPGHAWCTLPERNFSVKPGERRVRLLPMGICKYGRRNRSMGGIFSLSRTHIDVGPQRRRHCRG